MPSSRPLANTRCLTSLSSMTVGTVDGVVDEVAQFCGDKGVRFIATPENRGVPAAWNLICRHARSEVVFIVNDDVRPTAEGWLDAVSSVFELNPSVGIVYWCQKELDDRTGILQRFSADSTHFMTSAVRHPLLRSNFCGAFFALRRSLWSDIDQPDGSRGFWEDTRSYGEEIDFSSECHTRGMHVVQVPSVWEHLKSQTFRANPRTRVREQASAFLSVEEFAEIRASYPRAFGNTQRGRDEHFGKALRHIRRTLGWRAAPARLPMLEYSLAMVLKKWQVRTILGMNGAAYLEQLLADGYPQALKEAVARGALELPSTVKYRDCGIEHGAGLAECLSDPTAALV